MTTAPTSADQPPAPLWGRMAYSVGTVGFGFFDGATRSFLLLYYSQVLGLSPALAGLAIGASLVFDAISDPIVGAISDRTRSRMGRRHPFMFAAIIPAALLFYCLWNPPLFAAQHWLFAYLLVCAALSRMCLSLFEIPAAAILPEIISDHQERTKLMGWRYAAQFFGGMMATFGGYSLFFKATPDYANGVLNPDAYLPFSLYGAAVIVLSLGLCALGTWPMLARSRQISREAPPPTMRAPFKAIWQSFANPSFRLLIIFSVFTSLAFGMGTALGVFVNTFYWGLVSEQLLLFSLFSPAAIIIALVLTHVAGKALDKHVAAIGMSLAAIALIALPFILRELNILPPNGDPRLLPILLVINTFDLAMIIAATILTSSMVADIVEDAELKTGRRDEGVLFAVRNFAKNAVGGAGVALAGALLSLTHFPPKAKVGEVPQETIDLLVWSYLPTFVGLLVIGVLALSRYSITRDRHAENLRELAANQRLGPQTE
jgi:glycoside/pentoside/hexuronide:cation symporter, GPH family